MILAFGLLGACNAPEVIDCYDAAHAKKHTNCEVLGTIHQHDTIFEVVPENKLEDSPRLIGIIDPNYDKWPDAPHIGPIAKIEYCGPYNKKLGDYVLLEIDTNSQGTFSGIVKVDHCKR